MLTRDGVTEGAAAAAGVNPGACSTALTDHLCVRVRRGILLLVLLALAFALALLALAFALALLPLALTLTLVDSANIHRRQACQCVAGHDDASDLLSHNKVR